MFSVPGCIRGAAEVNNDQGLLAGGHRTGMSNFETSLKHGGVELS